MPRVSPAALLLVLLPLGARADAVPMPIPEGGSNPYIQLFGAALAVVIVGCAVYWVWSRRRGR